MDKRQKSRSNIYADVTESECKPFFCVCVCVLFAFV